MSIVKHYDKKTGLIFCYESTPHYDPVSKQSRPKRKYLGTWDPEKNELIPSSGKRGRKPGVKNRPKPEVTSADAEDPTTPTDDTCKLGAAMARIRELQKAVDRKEKQVLSLQELNAALSSRISEYEKACSHIDAILESLTSK